MEAEKNQTEIPTKPVKTSCRKNVKDDATFFEDVKGHIDEFIHASMAEHKTCFQNTINKMFGLSKAVAEKEAEKAKEAEKTKEVESQLPLQTTVSE